MALNCIVKATETVYQAFYALVKHFTPTSDYFTPKGHYCAPYGHYFAHWCGKRPFSLFVNGAQMRVLHVCVKKTFFTSAGRYNYEQVTAPTDIILAGGRREPAKLARRHKLTYLILEKMITFKKVKIVLSCAFLYNMYFIKKNLII